ncbi:hypothetical protein ACOSQ3_005374 [Xanthoceras sorbifolium]
MNEILIFIKIVSSLLMRLSHLLDVCLKTMLLFSPFPLWMLLWLLLVVLNGVCLIFNSVKINVDLAFASGGFVSVGAVMRDYLGSVKASFALPRLGCFSTEVGNRDTEEGKD